MRFIHTADLHLGAIPDAGYPWSRERAAAVEASIRRILQDAEDKKVDLLLIAGDLFHRQPLRKELKELNYQFSQLSHTRVFDTFLLTLASVFPLFAPFEGVFFVKFYKFFSACLC